MSNKDILRMSPLWDLADAPFVASSLPPAPGWLGMASPSTYFFAASFCAALGTIVALTYRNARATGSVGQLLYETTTASGHAARPGVKS
jgi:hypothetical protein